MDKTVKFHKYLTHKLHWRELQIENIEKKSLDYIYYIAESTEYTKISSELGNSVKLLVNNILELVSLY